MYTQTYIYIYIYIYIYYIILYYIILYNVYIHTYNILIRYMKKREKTSLKYFGVLPSLVTNQFFLTLLSIKQNMK